MKIKSLTYILLLAIISGGCKKSFLDVNKNPNSLTGTIDPSFVFTNALSQTANNLVGQNELGSYYAGHWTQSSSYIFSAATFAYQFTNTDFNFFDPTYNNLQDYQYVINNADARKQGFFKGPARVMKALIYQQLVDLYGNVPYSEALKGAGNLTPKFDDQKAIYENLILLLDSAITDLKANPFTGAFGSADVALKGNTTNWIKFANTLKLRILIRQSRIPGRDAYIIPQITKAAAEPAGFLGAGQDVGINPGYLASDGKQNPLYDRIGYNAAGAARGFARYNRPTKYLFDVLIATNDTFRLKRKAYANGGENGNAPGTSKLPEVVSNYKGVPFGAPSGFTAPSTAYPGPDVVVKGQFARPIYLMISAEAQLLLAEAVQRYGALGLPKSALEYYELGVRESFRLEGATAAQATSLLTSGLVEADFVASPDKLKAIWIQKWIALANFEGLEAWSEVRRTNYPPIPASAGAPIGQKPAVRLFYPASELGSNEKNVLAQGTIDIFNGRVFWDID